MDNTFVNDVMSKNVVTVVKTDWLQEVAKKWIHQTLVVLL